MSDYSAEGIVVLKGLEGVRRRPGMYVGDRPVHAMLWQVVDDAIEDHLEGGARRIRLEIDGDRVTVEDDGRGIAETTLERHTGTLHGGVGGLHGVGLAVVNALCTRFEVEVWRDARAYRVRYERGEQIGPLEDLGSTQRHGTRVTFEPDYAVIDREPWNLDEIRDRLQDLAALNSGLTLVLDREQFRCPDGLTDMVRRIAGDPWAEPIRIVEDARHVDVALLWTARRGCVVRGFVNQFPSGGGHVEALRWSLVEAVRELDDRLVRVNRPALFEVISAGLVAVVSVIVERPRFRTCSKEWLDNPEVGIAVRNTVTSRFSTALATDHDLRDRLLSRIPR